MKTYCLLNHALTENQLKELKEKFHSQQVIYPSKELSDAWSQIPPSEFLDRGIIFNVLGWLESAEPGDTFIVQGEFGTTFVLVDYALSHGLVPIHAVARRIATEVRDGEIVRKTYTFQHVAFRRYSNYKEFQKKNCL